MRNFWIEGSVDGRKTPITGGPRASNGGFELTVYVRDHGESVRAVKVTGKTLSDGTLMVDVDALGAPGLVAGPDFLRTYSQR